MPIIFHCFCGKKLKVEERLRGKKVKCPACGNLLIAQAAAVQAELPTKRTDAIEPDANSVSDQESGKQIEHATDARSGILGCAAFALFACLFFGGSGGYFWYQHNRAARRIESSNNLKQIALAMHAFDAANRTLPNHAILHPKTGQPLLSWRVSILRFAGEQELYNQIRRDEPWDSEHNRQFWNKIPKFYQLPGKPKDDKTYYQVFHGNESVFPKAKQPRFNVPMAGDVGIRGQSIADGTSNTFLVAEAANPVNWMKPEDIPFQMNQPGLMDRLGNHWSGDRFHVAFCDATVRFISRKIPPQTLQALITRAGGESMEFPD